MNLNVKLEVEEEQTLQYVNRFAINIPSGAAAFNLNFVNAGLSNQGYILNPVNPVGQNIVTYQPSMAVQSYIALPTEAEGNIIHSLPVGVPVPVGLPVPSGLIQNHNFVNTGIIIGNEDSNSHGAFQSSNNIKSENELKINFVEKPLEELTNNNGHSFDVQETGLDFSHHVNHEPVLKKPCPLEMSIKAANIDMEFEKCEAEMAVLLESKASDIKNQQLIIENMPLRDESESGSLKVPSETPSVHRPDEKGSNHSKTEITWENSNFKDKVINNDFQESLICEVEEVDDDEEVVKQEDQPERTRGGSDEENNRVCCNNYNNNKKFTLTGDHGEEKWSSSEESDAVPLSVALNLKKQTADGIDRDACHQKKSKKGKEEGKGRKKRSPKTKKEIKTAECDFQWTESDDDLLNIKRIKNEFNYKCFYEPKTTKAETSLVLRRNDELQKFVRVRSCCSKKECGKKISVGDQKAAYKSYCALESNAEKDAYLVNCIEHVKKSRNSAKEYTKDDAAATGFGNPEEKKLVVNANIQLEIENESNGNQKLSDEIENAIKESLKDCIANESKEVRRKREKGLAEEENLENGERGEKNTWNFFIVVDRCRKKVCLQFLLKLFRITKNRIKQLQKKILSGSSLVEDSAKTNQKPSEVWEMARSHLNNLLGEECPNCDADPKHRFLFENRTKEEVFVNFKEFYTNRTGREPAVKLSTYKRFLDKETTVSFVPKKEGTCARCEEIIRKQKRKNKEAKTSRRAKEPKPIPQRRKTGSVRADQEELPSSDDEPLIKRKRLKLTLPLKTANKKSHQLAGKRSCKNGSLDKKSRGRRKEEKSRQSSSKGRDVWSLMLLHLETMPYKECRGCVSKKRHRFLDPTLTTQALFEDYRKYFLKETNSELGLGFTMYEKYFTRNCNYTISELDPAAVVCPRCALDQSKS